MESMVTDLHRAVVSNEVGIIKRLLARGNSVHSTDSLGRTPLHWAIVLGHEEAFKALLLNISRHFIDVEDKFGRTPFHYACAAGKTYFVSILIKMGASVNARDSKGRTPLHYAAQNVKPDVIELLLKRGAIKDVGDCDGVKPWDLAVKWGCPHGFEILRVDSAQPGGFTHPKTQDPQAEMNVNGKVSADFDCNGADILKQNPSPENPSSLDILLREWERAEREARRKKKGVMNGVNESLKAWREAETEAKLKKQKTLTYESSEVDQDPKSQVFSSSSPSNSSQRSQNRGARYFLFITHPNGTSGSPATPS